ncbi:MAG TPA: ornithine cyclodeaminase family protein [Longimicrobiales bacterium]
MDTLILTRADVTALLPLSDCIRAVESAFRALGEGLIEPPATLSVHAGEGSFHVKAGVLPYQGRRYFASKANGNFPQNPAQRGLPTIQGLLMLSDADDGSVLAVMDSSGLTALRTAAATAVAARHLARPDAHVAAIIGCGVQGRVQLRALAEVLPLHEAHVYDVDAERARVFASELSASLRFPVVAEQQLAPALAAADVCVTCTASTDFIVGAEMVRPGMFIAGVGVDNEQKRELHPALLAGARIVTDLREQCARIGDLHHAILAGLVTQESVHADLADVVTGKQAGRQRSDEIIVFDSTGLAIQDVAAAAAVYERAVAAATTLQHCRFA